jgi:hypothetical protein
MRFERERVFYAQPMGEYKSPKNTARPDYFYLHGKAAELNGYDICLANCEALSECTRQGAFLCVVQFQNGTRKKAICFSVFKRNRMEGLICLLKDLEGVISCFSYFNLDTMPSMFSDEEEYLIRTGVYFVMREHLKGTF